MTVGIEKRCQKIQERYGVSISQSTLRQYYKENGITYTKVKKSLGCSKSPSELAKMRLEFI